MRPIFRALVLVMLLAACSPAPATPTQTAQTGFRVLGVIGGRTITFRSVGVSTISKGLEKDFPNEDYKTQTRKLILTEFSNVTYTWYSVNQSFDMTQNGTIVTRGTCTLENPTLIICTTKATHKEANGITTTSNVKWDFDLSARKVQVTFNRTSLKGDSGLRIIAEFDQELTLP